MEELKFKGELDADEVIEGLKEINEGLDETKKKAGQVSGKMDDVRQGDRKRKKDWKSLLDIFQSVLPRGMQRTIRGFMGTSRAVKRASVSFKVLGASIAAIGLPLLIQGLTWLIDNWEKVADFFTGTTQGMKDLEAATKRANEAVLEFQASNDALITSMQRVNITAEERVAAFEELKKVLVEAHDIDVNTAEGQRQIIALYEERLEQERLETLLRQQTNALAEAKVRAVEAEEKSTRKQREAAEDLARINRELNRTTNQYIELKAKQNERAEEHRLKMEAEAQAAKDAAEEQRKLQQAIDRANKSRETGNKMIADFENYMRTVGLEGLRLQEEQLAIQYEKDVANVEKTILDKKQRDEILKNLEVQYQIELANTRDNFANQELERQQAEDERKKEMADQEYIRQQDAEDKLRSFLESSQMEGIEKERSMAIDALVEKYDAMFLTAAENEELYQQLIEQQRADLLALNKKYDDKEQKQAEEAAQKDIDLLEQRANARNKFANTALAAVGAIIKSGEDNQEAQKKLAITEILLQQGQAFAAALRGAAAAAASQGAAAPFALPLYIAQMVGALSVGFAQIKDIMAEADTPADDLDLQTPRQSTVVETLVPTRGSADTTKLPPMQAYVVQSQLQGQNLLSKQLNGLSTL